MYFFVYGWTRIGSTDSDWELSDTSDPGFIPDGSPITFPFCFRLCWCGGWLLCVAAHSCFSLAAAAAAAAWCRRTPPPSQRQRPPQLISLNLATGFLRNSETVSWPVLGCMWTLWTMRKRGSLSESWIRIFWGTSMRRIIGTMWVRRPFIIFSVCYVDGCSATIFISWFFLWNHKN